MARSRQKNLFRRTRKAAQVILLSGAVGLFAAAADPSIRFNRLGHQLMCICGCGQILLECNHVGCPDSDGMRNELMAGVTRGDSDSLVEQAFVQKYGPTVLAAPPTVGFVNQAAWVVPFLALAVGLVAVAAVVRNWQKKPAPAIVDGLPLVKEELERLRDKADKDTSL